ncbi:50S ribosomal protein L11 [candidate division WWE3 bacterium]|nr:50S ribosomal protein L11 [candidate division WWE3 bacterium]
MAKKVKTVVKLNLPAGGATPAPPVGPALGQHGVPLMEFVNQYNKMTADKKGQIIPVECTIFEDGSFELALKTPPASSLILKAAGIPKGSGKSPSQKVGKITMDQVRSIAEEKKIDLNTKNVEQAAKIIAGTARSMGIDVI